MLQFPLLKATRDTKVKTPSAMPTWTCQKKQGTGAVSSLCFEEWQWFSQKSPFLNIRDAYIITFWFLVPKSPFVAVRSTCHFPPLPGHRRHTIVCPVVCTSHGSSLDFSKIWSPKPCLKNLESHLWLQLTPNWLFQAALFQETMPSGQGLKGKGVSERKAKGPFTW